MEAEGGSVDGGKNSVDVGENAMGASSRTLEIASRVKPITRNYGLAYGMEFLGFSYLPVPACWALSVVMFGLIWLHRSEVRSQITSKMAVKGNTR